MSKRKRALNDEFALMLEAEPDFPPFTREAVLFPQRRKFRYDFAFLDHRIAVEVQGGTWVKSGHTTGGGIRRDCAKGNLAQLMGWRCFHFTAKMIDDGTAIKTLREAFEFEELWPNTREAWHHIHPERPLDEEDMRQALNDLFRGEDG